MSVGYPRARRYLATYGFSPDELEAMSVGQAVAIAESYVIRELANNLAKWNFLPYHKAIPFMEEAEQEFQTAMADHQEPLPIATLLLPGFAASRRAEVRLESHLSALMAIEAIRLHAAQHERWPRALSQVDGVPVPDNPLTGQAFSYRFDDDMAVIDVADPRGFVPGDVRFELKLRK